MKQYAELETQGVAGQMPMQPPKLTDEEVERIAKVCHEANRAYCRTIGDESQPSWETAPDWQKQSARNGVLARSGLPPYSKRQSAEASHNNWMEEKLRAGWRYGPVKDSEKKEHPCLLPYLSLPKEQQRKDVLFIAVVVALDPRTDHF